MPGDAAAGRRRCRRGRGKTAPLRVSNRPGRTRPQVGDNGVAALNRAELAPWALPAVAEVGLTDNEARDRSGYLRFEFNTDSMRSNSLFNDMLQEGQSNTISLEPPSQH